MTLKRWSYTMLFTAALLVFSCSGETKKDATQEEKSEEKKTELNSGDLSKCTETSLSFDNPAVKGDGFEIKIAEAKFYMMASDGKQYPSIRIFFANYAKEGSYVQDPASADQKRIMIAINGLGGKTDLEAATYPATSEGFGAALNSSIGIQSGDAMGYLTGASGEAVITYISADKICGTAEIKGSDGTFVKSNFSVPLSR